MFLVVSSVLMFCVPVLGLFAVCLTIKLRHTLRHNNVTDQRQLRSQEKIVFWTVFFSCICLRKIVSISLS